MKKCIGCKLVTFIAAVGALNWLLIAVANLNLVAALLGDSAGAKIIYIVIGLAGLALLISMLIPCPMCKK